MGKLASPPSRASSAPAREAGAPEPSRAGPGRLSSRLAFGHAVVQRQPEPKRDWFPEKTQARKIDGLLNATPLDVKAVLAELETLGRDPSKVEALEKAYRQIFKKELDAALAEKLAGDDLSQARFLLYAPPPQKEFAEVDVTSAGTEAHRGKTASGGEATLHTGVEYERRDRSKYPDAFSVGYEGKDSKEARFIQFLWTEVLSTKPGRPAQAVPGAAISLSGTIELTTDTTKPKRIVDAIGDKSPFYENAGPDIRTGTGTRIFDRPAHSFQVVEKEFDEGATLVVERDHFDDYLIVGRKTVYRISHIVEWTFTAKKKHTRTPVFDSAAPVTALPADVKAVLVKRFPKFEYIQ